MRLWRRWSGVIACVAVSGCASLTKAGIASKALEAAVLAREADAEVARGCYECLRSATQKYEAALAAGAPVSRLKVAGAWILVAARERELGLQPSDAPDRAKRHAAAVTEPEAVSPLASTTRETVDAYLVLAGGLPHRMEGVSPETMRDISQAMKAMLGLLQKEGELHSLKMLRERALRDSDVTAEYLLRSFACTFVGRMTTGGGPAESPVSLPENPQPSNLMAFLGATCGNRRDPESESAVLARLVIEEPRFHEAHYFLGGLRLIEQKLVSAEREFLAAADGLPRMTAAWSRLGITRVAMEEYDWAVADFARALDIEPRQRATLLGHAQALNYAGRYEEALIPAQRLIDYGAWFLSDANFWLAFSELQLRRFHDADRHVREAKRTNPMNADTARLSGLVAYALAEFDRAQAEFELALSKNPADCESQLHMGLIHGYQARYEPSIVAFVKARGCYDGVALSAQARAAEIEAASLPESRKETMRLRLAQRVKAARRARAGACLGAAEGETQRGAYEAALAYLNDAASESEWGAKVSELRTRIAALQARR